MPGIGESCPDGQPDGRHPGLDELASSAQSGNRAALTDLAATIVPELTKRARGRFFRVNDCQDLANDAWLRIQENLQTYDVSLSFRPWANTILDRVCVDAIRKEAGADRYRGQPRGSNPDPSMLAIACEENLWVWSVLWTFGGYPHQQLAFAYCRLISGAPLEKPGIVRERHAHTIFDLLAEQCYQDYLAGADLRENTDSARELRGGMNCLFERLGHPFGHLVRGNPHDNIKAYSEQLLTTLTGETSMNSYVTDGDLGSSHIDKWVDKVFKRIKRAMLSESASGAKTWT